ncbi:MAG: phage replisome organizer N-terminal domain-containing protein [Bacillota bacterium]|nr:phage replisome organizer N-terminal domain-containing protein [Bacillota bacterium]
MAEKRYYWIKLKDTFMTSDTVDFLMGQKNGANYVVLYQMLCLKTVNTNGELARKIGEIIIPYDAEKIQRDCKYFDIDTIRVALELYKQLGLIYKQEDNILKIANFENMVGSETAWAEKKRIYREKIKQLEASGQSADNVLDDFRQEKDIRDKILDTRYKSIDIDSIDVNKSAHGRTRKEIINYIKERCDIELQELICSRCYGNTEVLELVIDTIADILSSGESLSIKNNKINSEALYELVRGINNKQLSSIIQGFYQEKDGKWVRKQVSVPDKYIFTVLFNQKEEK